jgi:hypothetical protein
LPLTLVGAGLKQPVGLALDQLGALYVASKEVEIQRDKFRRAVGKVHPDAHLSTFAEGVTRRSILAPQEHETQTQ